ncbi:hypothetical protein SXCC_02868 [Gluconacetobacter sp. SXCC-1]|nr:hypothetical protein SXCC_02868 [Gluconacetobacter sp. SXCC-1]
MRSVASSAFSRAYPISIILFVYIGTSALFYRRLRERIASIFFVFK